MSVTVPGHDIASEVTAAIDTVDFGVRRARVPYGSLVVVSMFVIMAAIGPMLAGDAATANSLPDRLKPPVLFGGAWSHPLGTDKLGRDILARLMAGSRTAFVIAVVSVGAAFVIGLLLGVVGGFFGGWRDSVVSRMVDITLAFPAVLLALMFAIQFGPSLTIVIAVITFLLWARFARQARGQATTIRNCEYIDAARAIGVKETWIVMRHVVPNSLSPLLILATLEIGWAILAEASLSFLGAGVPPPAPAWGTMVADGRDVLSTAWWVSTIPGLAIATVTVAVNFVGDWLRDVFDPGQA